MVLVGVFGTMSEDKVRGDRVYRILYCTYRLDSAGDLGVGYVAKVEVVHADD